MQEYYLDGNDNKTKTSFYQDINSGIYNNVAIGKIYFDNRLLWTAPKKKYAIINIYKMSRIRTIENNQYNYLTYDINFTKGALPEYYNVAEKDSPAAIYAKEGKLYSTADYAYFSELRLLNSYMGFGGIPTEGPITSQPIDIGNSNIWFNKSNYHGSYNDDGFMTFSDCYWNYQNIIFPNTVTNLSYTFSNAWGLTWQLPLKSSDFVLNMYYTYFNAGGGIEIINNKVQRKSINNWSTLCLMHEGGIGNNVLDMQSTFEGSSLTVPPWPHAMDNSWGFFGPNTVRAISTYRSCPMITAVGIDWMGHSDSNIFPTNLKYISQVFYNCQNLTTAVVGVQDPANTYIWEVYRDCPNINLILMDPTVSNFGGSIFGGWNWCIGGDCALLKDNIVFRAGGCGALLNASALGPSLGYNARRQVNNMSFSMSLNVVDFSYCADSCSNLNYFEFEGENVINIAWCFNNCNNLRNVYQRQLMQNCNTVDMSFTFSYCPKLEYDETLLITSKNLMTIQCCYFGCTNLKHIHDRYITSNWTRIGGDKLVNVSAAFQGCPLLGGNYYFASENIIYGDLLGYQSSPGRGNILNIYIKSNTLTNNSFAKHYAKNIWSNGNGYDDAANNIFIYYAERQPEYNRYKEANWG
jgi:hypothetical protein